MAHVTGIKMERTSKKRRIAHIDIDKHPRIIPYLKEVGAIEEDEFDQKLKTSLTSDEFWDSVKDFVNEWYDSQEK